MLCDHVRILFIFLLQELRRDGFDLALVRYRELKPILDEVIFCALVDIYFPCIGTMFHFCVVCHQLAILEAEQKAEEEVAETSAKKRGKRTNKNSMMMSASQSK